MAGIILRVAIQLALTIAALLGAQYSILNLVTGSHAKPTDIVEFTPFGHQLLSGEKQEVELIIRLSVVAIAFGILFIYEAIAYLIPKRNLLQFRKEYLDLEKADWRQQLQEDVRINLMYAKRRWYFLWLLPVFEWTWNDGFAPHHRDANMWICVIQGACGKAFRTKAAQFASIAPGSYETLKFSEKWLQANHYHLSRRQLRKTKHLAAVLSIPIVKRSHHLSPVYKAVGVINLDTETTAGAVLLEQNQLALAEYFTRFGKILAELKA